MRLLHNGPWETRGTDVVDTDGNRMASVPFMGVYRIDERAEIAQFIADAPETAAEADKLAALNARLVSALECMVVGACAVAVPHAGERAVLQEAVDIAHAALLEATAKEGEK